MVKHLGNTFKPSLITVLIDFFTISRLLFFHSQLFHKNFPLATLSEISRRQVLLSAHDELGGL
jgi:hypothetical protein